MEGGKTCITIILFIVFHYMIFQDQYPWLFKKLKKICYDLNENKFVDEKL